MEKTMEAPVQFTASAIEELNRLTMEDGFDRNQVLRIGVKGGGCSGLSYVLAFDQPEPGDEHFMIDGIPCVMKPAHGLYLVGMEINWSTGLEARGFEFTNPNASKTCGCGSSFSV
jgi:iron-sulfur cluster assembly accessory protein